MGLCFVIKTEPVALAALEKLVLRSPEEITGKNLWDLLGVLGALVAVFPADESLLDESDLWKESIPQGLAKAGSVRKIFSAEKSGRRFAAIFLPDKGASPDQLEQWTTTVSSMVRRFF